MGRMSRDHGRTPVQWDASPQAGFTTGTPARGEPGPRHGERRRPARRPGLGLRPPPPADRPVAHRAALTDGDFALLLPEHPTVWAFVRRGAGAELLVAANFSGDDVAVDLPIDGDWSAAEVVLANLPEPGGPAGLVLRPWSRWRGAGRAADRRRGTRATFPRRASLRLPARVGLPRLPVARRQDSAPGRPAPRRSCAARAHPQSAPPADPRLRGRAQPRPHAHVAGTRTGSARHVVAVAASHAARAASRGTAPPSVSTARSVSPA